MHVIPAFAGIQALWKADIVHIQGTLDSRLRGNDELVCGNDELVCGNDELVCGNDELGFGNNVMGLAKSPYISNVNTPWSHCQVI